jgi:hypothetical protein
MKKERRSYRRLYPKKALQVILTCEKPVIGRIHSISGGGVPFEYNDTCHIDHQAEITITLAMDLLSSHVVKDIPCKWVYDIPTLVENLTFRGTEMRLGGLAYLDLSRRQKEALDQLLAAAH